MWLYSSGQTEGVASDIFMRMSEKTEYYII